MRLVKLLIWLATLFFAAMLFVPLIREVIHRQSQTGQFP
jgi:preprotein translocase subunit SecG